VKHIAALQQNLTEINMFMDFKFFDEVVQQAEKQRKLAVQAWEQYVEQCEKAVKQVEKAFQVK